LERAEEVTKKLRDEQVSLLFKEPPQPVERPMSDDEILVAMATLWPDGSDTT
jgi:hypothetical protein